MGKTAVFVLSILHMIKPEKNTCQAVVLTHTRELALQIYNEFKRFAKELPVSIDYFLGGAYPDATCLPACLPAFLSPPG